MLQGITGDYTGVRRGYSGLQWVTRDYRGLEGVTRDYRGLFLVVKRAT